jgi:hypothetical protein
MPNATAKQRPVRICGVRLRLRRVSRKTTRPVAEALRATTSAGQDGGAVIIEVRMAAAQRARGYCSSIQGSRDSCRFIRCAALESLGKSVIRTATRT